MKPTNRHILYGCLLVLSCLLYSCDKRRDIAAPSVRLQLKVEGFKAPNADAKTTARTIVEPTDPKDIPIKNVWVIQLQNDIAEKATYIENYEQSPYIDILLMNGDFKFIFIVNTFDPNLLASCIDKSIDYIRNNYYQSFSFDTAGGAQGLFAEDPDGKQYLPLYGETEQYMDYLNASLIECTLSYNMTKVTVVLKQDFDYSTEENAVFKNITMCSVPSRHYILDQAETAKTTGTFTSSPVLEIVDATMKTAAGQTFTFYLPNNHQGSVPSIKHPFDKVLEKAPGQTNGTHIKITAEYNGYRYTYTYFLGGNMTSDFNLKRGYHYIYDLTFWSIGDDRDICDPVGVEHDNRITKERIAN